MKKPFLQDGALLNDITATAERERNSGTLDLWWLGQSGFLVHHRENVVLIDPYLSDSLTTKYTGTDKPHVRVSERVVDPAALATGLSHISLVTASHAHTDHLDPDTLRPLIASSQWLLGLLAPKAILQLAWERARLHFSTPPLFQMYGLDDGETWASGGLRVTAIASAHNSIDRDAAGHCKYLGYVFEFHEWRADTRLLRTWTGPRQWTVYHSGDTKLYPGLADRLRPFKIDVALLPINGDRPERRVAGNLNGREAAQVAHDVGAKLVIPCHYDMFEFNTADPADEFIPECERLGQPYRVLQQGERFSSSQLTP